MKILVTGGLGFIGSHTVVELIENGYEVMIVDNLYNSELEVKDKIKEITGIEPKVYVKDLLNKNELEKIFEENKIDSVIHFAGYKAVGESCKEPLKYYHNNLGATINLLEVMKEHDVKKIVFSSSATVYGTPEVHKFSESLGRGKTTNPYGNTKSMIEQILEDLYQSDNQWSIGVLRYFNPIGAHSSGLIGEKPVGIPNNLMPYILKVANGELEYLRVFGNDYNTHDGTGVRDYIHVVDLEKGHLKVLEKMENSGSGLYVYNFGSEKGYSVLDLVKTFEKVNNIKINYKIVQRRPGDIDEYYADSSKARKELGWTAEKTLEDICRDSWNFMKKLDRENQ